MAEMYMSGKRKGVFALWGPWHLLGFMKVTLRTQSGLALGGRSHFRLIRILQCNIKTSYGTDDVILFLWLINLFAVNFINVYYEFWSFSIHYLAYPPPSPTKTLLLPPKMSSYFGLFSFLLPTVFNCVCFINVWLFTRAWELLAVCVCGRKWDPILQQLWNAHVPQRGVDLQDHLPWAWRNAKRHNIVQILCCSHSFNEFLHATVMSYSGDTT